MTVDLLDRPPVLGPQENVFLKCQDPNCGKEFPIDGPDTAYCMEGLEIAPLAVVLDHDALRGNVTRESIAATGRFNMWRYEGLLPVRYNPATDIGVGLSPLVQADNLAVAIGLRPGQLFIKNDTVLPTLSFKDRPVSTGVNEALRREKTAFAFSSTGNLIRSIFAMSAHLGMVSWGFVPQDLDVEKIVAAWMYGGYVVKVNGNYDKANLLCTLLTDMYESWGTINNGLRPYYKTGSRTIAHEVSEQRGWHAPDVVVAPVASGSMFTQIGVGFDDLVKVGLLEEANVRMIGAQAEGCSPVASGYSQGLSEHIPIQNPDTLAQSLAIGKPGDGPAAIALARRTGGSVESVLETDIDPNVVLIARTTAINCGPEGGVVLGALRNAIARGEISDTDEVVICLTGTGVTRTRHFEEEGPFQASAHALIDPSPEAFKEAFPDPLNIGRPPVPGGGGWIQPRGVYREMSLI